ncbi:hypothetical protein CP556_00645 [Natrinema sp. CBA1119]|uniref:hypothetical protein n=1 Tax=Natrinema sp. CBA1119 TaxID=1608465 RepID=UPI000BF9F740|nr:hypothetical protein [Natrinema sp. CBA1119]PGF14772.1 hypothetical protein CP556_00645 [Natrinema sp. CBA1119]
MSRTTDGGDDAHRALEKLRPPTPSREGLAFGRTGRASVRLESDAEAVADGLAVDRICIEL